MAESTTEVSSTNEAPATASAAPEAVATSTVAESTPVATGTDDTASQSTTAAAAPDPTPAPVAPAPTPAPIAARPPAVKLAGSPPRNPLELTGYTAQFLTREQLSLWDRPSFSKTLVEIHKLWKWAIEDWEHEFYAANNRLPIARDRQEKQQWYNYLHEVKEWLKGLSGVEVLVDSEMEIVTESAKQQLMASWSAGTYGSPASKAAVAADDDNASDAGTEKYDDRDFEDYVEPAGAAVDAESARRKQQKDEEKNRRAYEKKRLELERVAAERRLKEERQQQKVEAEARKKQEKEEKQRMKDEKRLEKGPIEWEEHYEPRFKAFYFYNVNTKKTVWERPANARIRQLPDDQREAILRGTDSAVDLEAQALVDPEGAGDWQEHFDDAHKRLYYYNTKTRVTVWQRPLALVLQDEQKYRSKRANSVSEEVAK